MYDYQTQRPKLFTEDGQVMFLAVRDQTKLFIEVGGAARLDAVIRKIGGDTWLQIACFDRMIELGEIKEVTDPAKVVGQYRIFTSFNRTA